MKIGLPCKHFGECGVVVVAFRYLFVFLFNVFGSNLRHSHIWLGFGDKVENWIISPAQHQIHHSDSVKHFDTNFGTALAIWDRMFSCLIKSSSVKQISFGLGKDKTDHSSLAKIYLRPFTEAGSMRK